MKSDFPAALGRELTHLGRRHGISSDIAFMLWFATEILDLDEGAALEAVSVEGANDKGIDFFYVDDETENVLIAQGKYSPGLKYRAKERDVAILESSLNWLANPEALQREGRTELAEAASDYANALKDGYSVELAFVYAGSKSINIDKKIAVYNQNDDNISKRRTMRHYDLDLLKDLWEEIQGGRRRIAKQKLSFEDGHETEGAFGKAFVATVPCSEIVRLYQDHRDRLFDRNVRLFLGTRKGSVNAGMALTLKNSQERPYFWAYNNGLTIICDDFRVRGKKIDLNNFSIVNGCQTTVCLAENSGASSDVGVLVRCIAATAGIVDNVIRYTNSQNPIRTWDIASQDKTQRRLKNDFDKLKRPYLYLTRRGDHPKVDRRRYGEGGRLRQVRIDIVGQYMAAFRGDPVLAYKHKAFIFSRHHDDVFPADVRAEEVLFAYRSGEVAKQTVFARIKSHPDDARVLKKGGTLFVLALTAEVMKARNGVTFLRTIGEEQITSARAEERLRKYVDYAMQLYLAATSDEAEIQRDAELATLIRQREFFDKVRRRAIRNYEKDALNKDYIKGQLPALQ
jgi:hypothetical protein